MRSKTTKTNEVFFFVFFDSLRLFVVYRAGWWA